MTTTTTTTSSAEPCSGMVDINCAVSDTPYVTAADDSDYEVDEAEVI